MVYIIVQLRKQLTDWLLTMQEETGVVIYTKRAVHHRFVRSVENIAIVSESVT